MDSKILAAAAAGNLAICLAALAANMGKRRKIEKRKSRRTCWINTTRELNPHLDQSLETIFTNYKLCNEYGPCKTYALMDEIIFKELLSLIETDIKRVDTPMRRSIQVEAKLAAILRYLSQNETIAYIGQETNFSSSYLNISLLNVCNAIYNNLKSTYLACPNTVTEWQKIANEYECTYSFPMCLGALDCMHIQFNATRSEKVSNKFFNCYGTQSVYLIALVDATGKFIAIDVGQNGSNSYQKAFENSELMKILTDIETLKNNHDQLPYVVLTENNFKTSPNLIPPYPMKNQQRDDKIFNDKHYDAYNTVNDAFATLRHNFKLFDKLSTLGREKVISAVLCCCTLHNYLLEQKSPWYTKVTISRKDDKSEKGFKKSFYNKPSSNTRDIFRKYFSQR